MRVLGGISALAGALVFNVCIAPINTAHAQTVVNTIEDLQNIKNNLDGAYVLRHDIDAAATSGWNSGAGFLPIGTHDIPFTGELNGNGYRIVNLTINSPKDAVGVFGAVGVGGVVHNLGVAKGAIIGYASPYAAVGGLVGENNGTISNCSVSTPVTAQAIYNNTILDQSTGGLVGENGYSGKIIYSSATGAVSGANTGGLVGNNFGSIEHAFAAGAVNNNAGGYRGLGGLVGNNYGSISEAYAIGKVTGVNGRIGGLVGFNEYGTILNSYATGAVVGSQTIAAAFYIGGLVGQNNGTVGAAYSVGKITASASYYAGGLVGQGSTYSVTNGYWDKAKSGLATSSGGTGLTTAQLKAALPAGFDPAIWSIVPARSYPFLP